MGELKVEAFRPTYFFGPFHLDPAQRRLFRDGQDLRLPPKVFETLVLLVERRGLLVEKDDLMKALWPGTFVEEVTLARNISLLRKALGDAPGQDQSQYIETVSKRGYRFIAEVSERKDSPEDRTSTAPDSGIDPGPTSATASSTQQTLTGSWFLKLILPIAALFLVGLGSTIWYLRRPLPPLRVTEYTLITHDGRSKGLAGTDGSRLYFNWLNVPQPIEQVAVSGGEIVQVPTALQLPWLRDVSPDGSTLLVTSADGGQGSLWSVQVPSGSLRRLLTDVWVNSAAWSPDGKSVVYGTANGELYVIRSDGTGTRKLAALGGPPSAFSWSPDGSKIRFSRDNRLWEISSDGAGLHALLPGWRPSSPQCCGRWTPDGKFFVFTVERPLGYHYGSQLWTLDERRGLFRRAPAEPVQLTSGPIRWNRPILSKDGTKIFAQGVISRGELVRYEPQSHRLQPWLGGISAEFVSFSPDGQFVAYVTFPEGIMWMAHRDGSNPVQLTDPPMYPVNPRWSPDGTQILFYQQDSAGRSRNYLVPSHGGTPRLLLSEEKEGTSDANWSPDGRKIVFSSVQSVETIDSSDSVVRILDVGSHRVTTLPGSDGVWSPRWSPNGRFIAGIHTGAPEGLRVFDLETQRWSVLQLKGETDWPTWSSNSQFIYFLRHRDDPGVFRVRVADGVEERVVELKGFRFTGSLTMWMGLDPEGTPTLLRDVGTADLYALTLETK